MPAVSISFWLLFIILPVVLVAIIVPVSVVSSRRRKAQTAMELQRMDYSLSSIGFSSQNMIQIRDIALCVDDKSLRWCLKESGQTEPVVYRFSDLNDFEINEDGFSIIKGGGLGIGLGLGPIGVGLGRGRSKSRGVATLMELRIRINDIRRPEVVLPIFRRKIKKESITYRKYFEKAKEFAAMLTYIQNHTAKEAEAATMNVTPQPAALVKNAPKPAERVCPSCSTSLTNSMSYCPRCGFNTTQIPTCPKCGTQLVGNAVFCTSCGLHL